MRTSFPRNSVNSSRPVTVAKASTAGGAVLTSFWVDAAAPVVATGASASCTPRAAQSSQMTVSAQTVQVAEARWWAVNLVSRRADQVTSRSTATRTRAAAATAAAVRYGPAESRRKPTADLR